jgi:hypothetical protein
LKAWIARKVPSGIGPFPLRPERQSARPFSHLNRRIAPP